MNDWFKFKTFYVINEWKPNIACNIFLTILSKTATYLKVQFYLKINNIKPLGNIIRLLSLQYTSLTTAQYLNLTCVKNKNTITCIIVKCLPNFWVLYNFKLFVFILFFFLKMFVYFSSYIPLITLLIYWLYIFSTKIIIY